MMMFKNRSDEVVSLCRRLTEIVQPCYGLTVSDYTMAVSAVQAYALLVLQSHERMFGKQEVK